MLQAKQELLAALADGLERLSPGAGEKAVFELPKAAAPVANYVPVVIAGKTVYTSGQVTVLNGEFKYQGKLGKGLIDVEASVKLPH